uniref:Uncharacterized protein n=1 Tax=Aureoumbra lagunensis TaxID=44058 RepID=A0A7S3JWJ2_9STRA|mmetsp:Transcript_16921/g.21927  ORF Transcript_16921/g.21927 Transcript_16921/m.21927 type:complete len:424 (+) Transcript_16921:117-1388(+)|eukprot:CAMPEP_0197287856 /NCGR_PEP_ID=MMETSP0890-20130614/4644_1 /TAXON_ID=44058 ORGANISM="Aureoumbra lagunensis, Strain CCMP1510" /NCGR_SAMPLE_ID=MMETSP0890 /ASSEMBLY_ACC=CAM_ASM_000533 /LENGTH=423 /DNA_ID=CAMNT_0042758055 /DNA_START=91 /DNA_END=1362 /DNA_ORIENTATION=+
MPNRFHGGYHTKVGGTQELPLIGKASVDEIDSMKVHPSHQVQNETIIKNQKRPVVVCGLVEAKYLVCALLVVQNTGAVLLMRYTRSMPGQSNFATQTAVIMQECLKGLACIPLLLREYGTVSSAWEKPREALKTSVPALLYLVQNNLQYVAVTYLDAATYTVSYQTKIVWSGILSVLLLSRKLSLHKWLGIALLAVGVGVVQIAGTQAEDSDLSAKEDLSNPAKDQINQKSIDVAHTLRLVGMTAVITAAMVSALAGVYFEKILKGARVGLWTRNLQLAFYSVLVGYIKLATSAEGLRIRSGELTFFHGYTRLTWLCIATNAFGGLLVGTVIKYADAVMKDVALGCSIVLSSLISTILFDFQLNSLFIAGITAVIYAVFLYGERATCGGLLPTKNEAKPTSHEASATDITPTTKQVNGQLNKV